jgi:hypothetical protein
LLIGPMPLPDLFATPTPTLQWIFALPAPLAKMKDTIATLTSLQKNIAQQNNGLTLSFNVQGTQVSTQLQQSFVCPIPDLLADAQAQAQKLSSAAGLNLGTVLAMSSGTSSPVGATSAVSLPGFLLTTPILPSVCSMTVKFALLRY